MRKSIVRKLILSVASLTATAVCLTSTTYAWFAKNANAWTDPFTVNIHTFEGLQISIDGVNYYDSVDKDQLLKAIALSRYNLENDATAKIEDLTDAEVTSYSYTSLAPVSPDANFNFYGFATVDNPVEDFDTFIENNYYKPINLTQNKKSKSYIQFDLWFRNIPTSKDPKDAYKLIFVDKDYAEEKELTQTYIEGLPSTVKLNNKLTTPTKTYASGEEIEINPKDAMRIGVVGTNKLIFEPNQGIASTAYENYPTTSGDYNLHDPNQNPMVTYFNNTHTKANLYVKDYSEYVETEKDFNGKKELALFEKQADGSYNDAKITVYLWLDGYDADYLEGVNTESVHFFLNFTKVGV